MLWIGHPWLSVRGEENDLTVSGPHESADPEPRWVIDRRLVGPAVEAAVAELELFADRIAGALLDADGNGARVAVARRLAGLPAADEDSTE